jgi:HNH endonuclease
MSDSKLIPLPNSMLAIVDDEDYEELSRYKWGVRVAKYGCYVRRMVYAGGKGTSVYIHRQILGFPDSLIDHINRNPLDNRKSNLRLCTRSQNNANGPSIGTSKFRGVHFMTARKRWRSNIIINGKVVSVGTFSTEVEAAMAYNERAKEFYGEFANLNKID